MKNLLLFFYFVVILLLPWQFVTAAILYFDAQDFYAGTEDTFSVAVNITATTSINAVEVAILVPPEITPYDINESNSIINFWVDKPSWNDSNRLLTFSGIVPGGFIGENARLLLIKFNVEKAGRSVVDFLADKTNVYLNTPDGLKDHLSTISLDLPVTKGKENVQLNKPDFYPPENFIPQISRVSTMFGGKWFLVFATQDKGSGVAFYEIQESNKPEPRQKKWEKKESPYLIKDQSLTSYIYVKAVDKAGNERIAVVKPKITTPVYKKIVFRCIIIVLIVIFLAYLKKFGIFKK